MTRAIAAGHMCLDIIPDLSAFAPEQFDASFRPGRLVQTGPATLTVGGSVANTGIALHRLGICTRLIARTGEDTLGTTLRQCVEQFGTGLSAGLTTRAESTTSYSLVISPPGEDRRFLHNPGANDDFAAEDVSDEALSEAGLFHFGYPPLMANMYARNGDELRKLFERAKSHGLTTSLDMAYPDPESPSGRADWLSILQNVLPYVDIFVPSFDEISYMLWKKTDISLSAPLLAKASNILLGMGAKIVVLKLGSRGLFLRTASRSGFTKPGHAFTASLDDWSDFNAWLPCYCVNVTGTTGAGDVTVAGFLAALMKGMSPLEAMKTALAAGACCVEEADALSGIRGWDETLARTQSGWKTHPEPEQFIKFPR